LNGLKFSNMRSNPLLWLLFFVLIALPIVFWLGRRQGDRRAGWKCRNETLPGLGAVTATYQNGELLWYDLKRGNVTVTTAAA
jgi:hypothetical protein